MKKYWKKHLQNILFLTFRIRDEKKKENKLDTTSQKSKGYFTKAENALQCALALHNVLKENNPMEIRVGIHYGEILEIKDDHDFLYQYCVHGSCPVSVFSCASIIKLHIFCVPFDRS